MIFSDILKILELDPSVIYSATQGNKTKLREDCSRLQSTFKTKTARIKFANGREVISRISGVNAIAKRDDPNHLLMTICGSAKIRITTYNCLEIESMSIISQPDFKYYLVRYTGENSISYYDLIKAENPSAAIKIGSERIGLPTPELINKLSTNFLESLGRTIWEYRISEQFILPMILRK